MQFHREADSTSYAIRGYAAGEVTVIIPFQAPDPAPNAVEAIAPDTSRVRQEILYQSLIITPEELIRDWPPQAFEELTETHMAPLVERHPEVVLLGMGKQLQWPERTIIDPLFAAGIGVEVMDTAAACRTYNILMADGRRVAAALMMI